MKDKEKQIEEIVRFIDTHIMAKKIAELIPSKIVSYDGRSKGQHLYIEQKMEIAKEIMNQGVVVWTMDEHAKLVSQVRQEFEHEYKDKVVLSREELKEKYVPKSFYELAKKVHEEKVEELENLIKYWIENWKQASKETAEKILQIIDFIDKKYQNYAKEELQSSMVAKAFKAVANEIKIEIAKQLGVEIKE